MNDMRNEDRIMEAQDIAQEKNRGDEVIEPILWEDDEMMTMLEQKLSFGHLELLKLWWEPLVDGGLSQDKAYRLSKVSNYLHAMNMLLNYPDSVKEDIKWLNELANDQSEVYAR